ncbi:MAG: hypothetical protein OJF59_000166 [Cytophagales bacterium]|jgi:uncharacterized UPF0160 family protein|nr:hypothetical protein [Bacteroidota bacterium]MBS1982113.1 hypothetical protein [Bacteroidota bacterium]WHZ06413.1 MAG: hypothetical protein OJF59_000166 [Cytophagales bacterium]
MSTYAYTIVFNDSEIIMLQSALSLMIDHCQKKLDEGEGAPYWAHLSSAKEVLKKLDSDVVQVSGNNFNRQHFEKE